MGRAAAATTAVVVVVGGGGDFAAAAQTANLACNRIRIVDTKRRQRPAGKRTRHSRTHSLSLTQTHKTNNVGKHRGRTRPSRGHRDWQLSLQSIQQQQIN